jgi:hypothetical protein
MPTNRTRRTRGQRHPLTAPEKHLLLTGECTPDKGCWRDQGELIFRTFCLVSPAGRNELRNLWIQNRETLLAEWMTEKRVGLPWAAKEFDHEKHGKEF